MDNKKPITSAQIDQWINTWREVLDFKEQQLREFCRQLIDERDKAVAALAETKPKDSD